MLLVLEQCLNDLQSGLLRFLLAAGLTLLFGMTGLVDLARGSFYMLAASLRPAALTSFVLSWLRAPRRVWSQWRVARALMSSADLSGFRRYDFG
jgi:branched-subunit amino acid ABC-type transport system permease component